MNDQNDLLNHATRNEIYGSSTGNRHTTIATAAHHVGRRKRKDNNEKKMKRELRSIHHRLGQCVSLSILHCLSTAHKVVHFFFFSPFDRTTTDRPRKCQACRQRHASNLASTIASDDERWRDGCPKITTTEEEEEKNPKRRRNTHLIASNSL